jgi:hypothetical protein
VEEYFCHLTKIAFFILINLLASCGKKEILIEITNPEDGAVVEGIVEITARVTDGKNVTVLGFFINDSLVKFFEKEPYSYKWNTIPLPDSSIHTIYAKESLENGNYVSSETI